MENKNETSTENNQPVASETIAMQREQFILLSKIAFFAMALQALIIAGLLIAIVLLAQANERNNQRWLDYLSQYDFVSQDGEGTNYFNSEIGGDVTNGTPGSEE